MAIILTRLKQKVVKRVIPMSDTVRMAFENEIQNRRKVETYKIDGYSDFIFLNRNGYPMYESNLNGSFRNLVKKYNKLHPENELPHITPHLLRHTFCTNMANLKMSPINLQYVMGHKNITMTLGHYAHGTFEAAQEEMKLLAT